MNIVGNCVTSWHSLSYGDLTKPQMKFRYEWVLFPALKMNVFIHSCRELVPCLFKKMIISVKVKGPLFPGKLIYLTDIFPNQHSSLISNNYFLYGYHVHLDADPLSRGFSTAIITHWVCTLKSISRKCHTTNDKAWRDDWPMVTCHSRTRDVLHRLVTVIIENELIHKL